jgi:parallel beta-helix repeat protein
MRLLGAARWAVLIAAFALLGLVPTAMANHVQCGDVIIQDTTLDSDLVDCPGDGIVIGADGVTLDLGGHMIGGAGDPFLAQTIGVSVGEYPSGVSGVTIENGSVQDFSFGVALESARAVTVRNLTIPSAGTAVDSARGQQNRIERNLIYGASISVADLAGTVVDRNVLSAGSIEVTGGAHTVVSRNYVAESLRGVRISESADNTVIRNTVTGNVTGIWATNSAYRSRIERNLAYGNTGDGIQVECCESVVVRNVALANGDDGIYVAWDGLDEFEANLVAGNTANYNADLGIEAVGSGVIDGGGNRARHNGNPAQCVGVRCK